MQATKRIVIYGAGGFGREVAWLIEDCNREEPGRYEIACFIDDNAAYQGARVNQIPVYSLPDAADRFAGAVVVGGIGNPKVRESLMMKAERSGFRFESIVHPRVERSQWIDMGTGVLICAGNILTTNIVLAAHVQINLGCTIGHDVVMGDFATLAPGVHVSGCVQIGKRVYIGTGAVLLNGTSENPIIIGDDVTIGAGACVTKSVAAGLTVVGVPAKPLQRT